jgi:sulfoxide reductase heme-binding subunit YedZ
MSAAALEHGRRDAGTASRLGPLAFGLCLAPGLWLAGEWATGQLGINPLNRLLHFSGRTALWLLLLTLGVGPLRSGLVSTAQRLQWRLGRRWSDWNDLIVLRRQFGRLAFGYAVLHLVLYAALDAGWDWSTWLDDATERPFVLLGWLGLALLLPLMLTSSRRAQCLLGAHWRRVHSLVYPAAALVLLHFVLQAKVIPAWPGFEAVAVLVLLALRARAWWQGRRGPAQVVLLRLRRWRGRGGPPA